MVSRVGNVNPKALPRVIKTLLNTLDR